MENQHRKIQGYRELTQSEIDSMNKLKELECQVLATLQTALHDGADPLWCATAKTDLQKAFMAAGRAVARPDGY